MARAFGSGGHVPVLFWTGLVRTATGRLGPAAELLDDAVDIARTVGSPAMLGWTLLARSLAGTSAGDSDLALEAARASIEALHGPAPTLPCAWAGLAHAAALELEGEPAQAERALLGAAAGEGLRLLPHPLRPAAFELLTRIRITLDDRPGAGRAAAAAHTCAERSGLVSARATAQAASGVLALYDGDSRRAGDLALWAADASAGTGAATTSAQHRMLAARALADTGRRDEAIRQLQRAAEDFDLCGAPRRRTAAERELRRLGHRGLHRRTRPGDAAAGLDSLSEREWEIARLVTDRLTNAEIAGALFLSTKTVETHVSNLFHKLAVSSRVEIARTIEAADQDHVR